MKSVWRVVQTIDYIRSHPGVRLGEISGQLKIHKSNASRLLSALERHGWVVRDAGGLAYQIGPRLISVGNDAIDHFSLADQLIPMMLELRDVSGETVHLAVFDNDEMLHIRKVESHDVVRVSCALGARDKLHCTALGKAFLAALPDADSKRIITRLRLEKRTPNTLTTPEALLSEIKLTRGRGYAIDNEEGRLGVRCVGLALVDSGGRALGALSITGPAHRWTQRAMRKVVSRLLAIAEEGMTKAGYQGLVARRSNRRGQATIHR
jgi:IclR family acetate operon transcriptional repressor